MKTAILNLTGKLALLLLFLSPAIKANATGIDLMPKTQSILLNQTKTYGELTPFKFDLNRPFGLTDTWAAKDKPYKRKSPFLASALNFFLPGAGYLYNGQKHPLVSVGMMAGAVGLTYVELSLQNLQPDLYPIMFGSVFVLNTSIAIDTFFKTKRKNEEHNL